MASITYELTPRWLNVCVEGVLTRDEVIAVIDHVYPLNISSAVIWDMARANLDQLHLVDFQTVACHANRNATRLNERTAYFGPSEVFSKMCMYAAIAAMEGNVVEYSAFMRREEAELWATSSHSVLDQERAVSKGSRFAPSKPLQLHAD